MTELRDRIRTTAKRAAIFADGPRGITNGVVLLAYHRVGQRTDSPVDLSTNVFKTQLDHLAACANVSTLDSAVELLSRPEGDPQAQDLVLTFDDGTADFVDVVLPLLVERQLPATLYVATEHIDSQKLFPNHGQPLTWDGLRECASTGLVTVGAHTHTHLLLDRCDPLTVDLELAVSNARIAEELGCPARHFAYPKAVLGSPYADGAVRNLYSSAAVAGTRPNVVGATDLWRLHRSPIQVADGWEGFVRKAEGGMRVEDDVRRIVNTVRYRGRTS